MVKLKNRYILVEFVPIDDRVVFSQEEYSLFKLLLHWVYELHGDHGAAAIKGNLHVKLVEHNIALIRVGCEAYEMVASVIPFVSSVGGKDAVIMTRFVGRSVRACEKTLIGIRRRELLDKLSSLTDEQQRGIVQHAIRNVTGKIDFTG